MENSDLFWTVFAAVFGANVLTAMLVWGFVIRSRLEREGREGNTPRHIYIAIFLPLFLLVSGFGIAFGKF